MLIAKLKKETNIVEYILYMYQIEDIIRSFQFDLKLIDQHIVQQFDQNETVKAEIKDWYAGMINGMKFQEIEKTGHLNDLKETIHTILVCIFSIRT